MSVSDVANRLITDREQTANGGHRQWCGQQQMTNGSYVSLGQFGCRIGRADRVALLSGAIGIVVALSASKQMVRVHARRVIALVKNAQACVQASIGGFIYEAMGSYLVPIVVVDDAVTLAVCSAGPQPTVFRSLDERKVFSRSNFDRWCGGFPSRACAFLGAEPDVLCGHLLAAMFTVMRGPHSLIIRRRRAGRVGL